MKRNDLILLISFCMFFGVTISAQNCQASFTYTQGALPGEIIFTDNSPIYPNSPSLWSGSIVSTRISSSPVSGPNAGNGNISSQYGSTSIQYGYNGTYHVQYYLNGGTCNSSFADTIVMSNIPTGIPCSAGLNVAQGPNPGSILITDNSIGEDIGTFETSGPMIMTIPATILTQANSTDTIQYPENGVYYYNYHIANTMTGCYDSLYGNVSVNSYPCQALASAYTTQSLPAGQFIVNNYSTYAHINTLIAPDATVPTQTLGPVQPNVYQPFILNFTTNGTFPYSLIILDTISGCSDTLNGTITVSVYALPCNIQAALTINPGTNLGEVVLTDNSTGGNYTEFYTSNSTSPIPVTINGTVSTTYPNGSYNYAYLVMDTNTLCKDTIMGVFTVTNSVTCNTQASLNITPGLNVGELNITDNSTNASTGTLHYWDGPNAYSTPISLSSSTTVTFNSNGTHQYFYHVYDSTGLCQDTTNGTISVSGIPCNIAAGVTITPHTNPGLFQITDNSTGNPNSSHFLTGFLGADVQLLPYASAYIGYSLNGTYNYQYIVLDSNTTCADTMYGTLSVADSTLCSVSAGVNWNFGPNPGEIIITDQSYNAYTSTFYSSGITGGSAPVLPSNPVTLQFNSNGFYTYTYVVHDSLNLCSDTAVAMLNVLNLPCPGGFAGITVSQGTNPGEIVLTDNSTAGDFSTFYSGFGGSAAILPNPTASITYPTNGTYTYSYVVLDTAATCFDTIVGTITISNIPPPCNIQAALTVTNGTSPGQFILTDNSTNATAGAFIQMSGSPNIQVLSPNSISATYSANGTYSYTYVAIDSNTNCIDTLIGVLTVTNAQIPCNLQAGVSVTSNGIPGQFTFTDNSSGGDISYIEPGFGSSIPLLPNTSTLVTFPSNGTYNYTYIVVDSASSPWCIDTTFAAVTVTGIVTSPPCSANFTLLQDSLNPSQYYCWNTSTNGLGATIGLTYLWDFGDGNTSTLAYPTHTYNSLGMFALCLTITDSSGCTDTHCDTISITVHAAGTTINVLPPDANLGLNELAVLSEVTLYPNPSDGNFKVDIESSISSNIELSIANMAGQILYQIESEVNIGSNSIQINQTDLAKGVYLVNIKDLNSNEKKMLRIIKK